MTAVKEMRVRTVSGGSARGSAARSRWRTRYVLAAVLSDLCAALLAALTWAIVRADEVGPQGAWTVVFVAGFLVAAAMARAYDDRYLSRGAEEYRAILRAGVGLGGLGALVGYLTEFEVPRSLLLVAMPFTLLLATTGRWLVRRGVSRARRRGRCIDRVLVVGHAGPVADLVNQLQREPYCGLKVVGLCVPDAEAERAERETGKVYAGFDGAGEAAVAAGADVVAVTAASEMVGPALRRLSWQLANHDISLAVAPGLMEVAGPRLHIRPVAGLPLLHVEHPRLDGLSRVCKGLFDRVLAAVALTLLLPAFAVIGVLVGTTSQGPVLFRQRRVGQGGQTFTCLKFRTMVADAELRLHEVAHLNRHPDGPLFKIMDDPRVTPLGMFLRRYSLDELPQLFHVLTGRMSLVGPRPPLPDEVASYTDDVRRRLLVKPGLTGLWQISGRSNLSWDESVRLDLRYVENWSFALDLLILKKTLSAVVRGTGAY